MNLELRDDLDALKDSVSEFIDIADALELNQEEGEYNFLEDESGISSTKLELLIDHLKRIVDMINQLV